MWFGAHYARAERLGKRGVRNVPNHVRVEATLKTSRFGLTVMNAVDSMERPGERGYSVQPRFIPPGCRGPACRERSCQSKDAKKDPRLWSKMSVERISLPSWADLILSLNK